MMKGTITSIFTMKLLSPFEMSSLISFSRMLFCVKHDFECYCSLSKQIYVSLIILLSNLNRLFRWVGVSFANLSLKLARFHR